MAGTRVTALDREHGVWRIENETNGYLLVREGASLLIDCPAADAASALQAAGLPLPERILHTQVQEEHCREWAAFPCVPVSVSAEARPVAERAAVFFQESETLWPDDRAWETLGEDKYGIAGCMTERPPVKPLNVASVFAPGEVIRWRGVELEVAALPSSGKRSVGFVWRTAGVAFTGDLVHAGGKLVNFYDLERSYGGIALKATEAAFAQAGQWGVARFLPGTGPIVEQPVADMARVLDLLKKPNRAGVRRQGTRSGMTNFDTVRTFGRYCEIVKGVYQNTNFGNIVLFVDDAGRGLMVDPCNCVWLDWEGSVASMHADLDELEREAGLKTVDTVLITHPHGDHIQYCDLLRQRYGATVLATPDVAALMERPADFPYPCLNDWYNFPFKTVTVDRRLHYGEPFDWHGVAVTPVHTPGHCFAHAGFALSWHGERVFCSGDVIQHGGGAIGTGLPFCYNDNGAPDRSPLVTMRRVAAFKPDLVCCGHSRSFRDPDGGIIRDWVELWQTQIAALKGYVPDGDLLRASTPPGYDAVRPSLDD